MKSRQARPSERLSRPVTLLLGLVLLSCLQNVHAFQDTPWAPIGPESATVFRLVRDPSNPAILYAGTHFGGLYRSTDLGISWNPVPGPFSEATLFAMAIDPEDSSRLFVSAFGGDVYRSIDNGNTWQSLPVNLAGEDVTTLAIDPVSKRILAATTSAMTVSSDGGLTWQPAGNGLIAGANAIAFTSSGIAYAATPTEGVMMSTDGGQSWTPLSTGLQGSQVSKVVIGNDGQTILAITEAGVSYLAPGAAQWSDISLDLPDEPISDLVQHPLTGRLYAAVITPGTLPAGIYVSDAPPDTMTAWTLLDANPSRLLTIDPTGSIMHVARAIGRMEATVDNGASFFPVTQGMQNVFAGAFASVDIGGSSVLWASTDLGVFISSDPHVQTPFWIAGGLNEKPFSLVANQQQLGEIFAGGENGTGVSRSDDWGSSWTSFADGMVPNQIYDIDQSPAGNKPVYAGTSGGLFVSRDDGQTWTKATDAATPARVFSVAADPVAPGIAYFGAGDGEIFVTLDGGENVFRAPVEGIPADAEIVEIAVVPWGSIYVLTNGGIPYASNPERTLWSPIGAGINEPALSIAVTPGEPWRLYVGTAGGGIYRSTSGGLEWQAANVGLGAGVVFSIYIDPTDTARLLIGTTQGLFLSTDGGDNWQPLGSGLPSGIIDNILADPANNQTLYASVRDTGVYRSLDGGSTWLPVATGTPFTGSLPLAASTQSGQTFLVGTALQGVYRSTDNAATWSPSSTGMSLLVRALAIDPADSSNLYAGSLGNGLFRSSNGGANWSPTGLSEVTHFALSVDPFDATRIFAATSAGMARSLDRGLTWQLLGQRVNSAFSIAVDKSVPGSVFIGAANGAVFFSADDGQSWEQRSTGLADGTILAMTMDASQGVLLAASEQQGIFRSDNGGLKWTRTNDEILGSAQVTRLELDSFGNLFACTNKQGVFWSPDLGDNWLDISAGLGSLSVKAVTSDPVNGTLYAAVANALPSDPAVYVFDGVTGLWQPRASGIASGVATDLAVDPLTPTTLYVSTDSGIYKSTDAGTTWQPANNGLGALVTMDLLTETDAQGGTILFAATAGAGVYTSTDGGNTWSPVNNGMESAQVTVLASKGTQGGLYAGTQLSGLRATDDGGQTWSAGYSDDLRTSSLAVQHSYTTAGVLYSATAGAGVLKSADGGATWTAKNNGLSNLFLLSLAVDPQDDNIVYAGSSLGGVFVSEDGGESWHALNTGLLHKNVTALSIDASNHKIVYAGTEGGGVFRNVRP